MSAWVFQEQKQVEKNGDAASWSVGWYDPEGKRRCKSCGPGTEGKRNAEKLRKKIDAELLTGTYRSNDKKTWEEFREEYDRRILTGLAIRSGDEARTALDHFERLVGPKRIAVLKTQHVDDYVAARRGEPGKKQGDTVSPATVNKELRHIKAALRVADEWGYLAKVPRFRMEKVPGKLPSYVTGVHFAAIYKACETATMPADLPFPAAVWWRGLVVMGYMTGWRISDMLGLRRDDLDLQVGEAVTRARINKGKRDERVKLHPVVVERAFQASWIAQEAAKWLDASVSELREQLELPLERFERARGVELKGKSVDWLHTKNPATSDIRVVVQRCGRTNSPWRERS